VSSSDLKSSNFVNTYLRTLGRFFVLCSLATFCACSSAKSKGPQELPVNGSDELSEDADELFKTANMLFEDGLFIGAQSNYDRLRNNYPTGPYREFAELKAADALFFQRDFVVAAQRFEQFAKEHPSSPSADYALFMNARSLQLQNAGPGRNMNALEQAISAYQRLLQKYPSSVYQKPARSRLNQALRLKKIHEENVATFYSRRSADSAAESRMRAAQSIKTEK
jgi:outer membrane protein assembly factor BamD